MLHIKPIKKLFEFAKRFSAIHLSPFFLSFTIFLLGGRKVKINVLTIYFVGKFDWIEAQIKTFKKAFDLLSEPQYLVYKNKVQEYIKTIIFSEIKNVNHRLAYDGCTLMYKKGYTDDYIYLASLLYKFALMVENQDLLRNKRVEISNEGQKKFLSLFPN